MCTEYRECLNNRNRKAIRRKNKVKIYITGSVASGKSTLARRISQITKIPCYHLDEVVHIPAPEEASGNKKRPIEERDALFHDILNTFNRSSILS